MTVIPPITDPLGKYWDQPPLKDILVDDTYAIMTKETLEKLADYSHYSISGVYQGKMWRRKYIEIVEKEGRVYTRWTGEWKLCWYGPDPNNEPGYVGNYYRKILLID